MADSERHFAEYERLRAEANDLARRLHETTQDYVDLKEENQRLRAQHADCVRTEQVCDLAFWKRRAERLEAEVLKLRATQRIDHEALQQMRETDNRLLEGGADYA